MTIKHETRHYQGLKINVSAWYSLDYSSALFNMDCSTGDLMIGCCSLTYKDENDKRKVHIRNFLIEKQYRGKGYGSRFWKFIEKYIIKKASKPSEFHGDILPVDDFNIASSFWRKMGFQIIDKCSTSDEHTSGRIFKKANKTS